VKALDYILDAFEKALQLERELGVKSVECDLALLKKAAPAPAPVPAPATMPENAVPAKAQSPATPASAAAAVPERPVAPKAPAGAGAKRYDFVFLHDRPLSDGGVEMMAKIIGAMRSSVEASPIIVAGPPPPAKIYVVLGGNALKKYFPGVKGAPGQWLKIDAVDVLVTNSPEYILRFGAGNAAVQKIKQDMWRSLKTVMQRLEA
jgi:hypothetical protein